MGIRLVGKSRITCLKKSVKSINVLESMVETNGFICCYSTCIFNKKYERVYFSETEASPRFFTYLHHVRNILIHLLNPLRLGLLAGLTNTFLDLGGKFA